MKKLLKNMIPATILSFLASFMLYIYEPIVTYASNINDFWFDSKLMLPNIFKCFLIIFFALIFIFSYIYLLCYALKKEKIYKVILSISFVCLIFTYIQGVYLSGSLPQIDGETIDWNSYGKEKIISAIVFIIILGIDIFGIVKFKINKTLKANCFIMCAVFVMLLTSFVSALTNPRFYKEKSITISTEKNLNTVSSDKNYLILLVDAVDSSEFHSLIDGNDIFKDFTYYPDTVSGYTFTRDSIPFIFSGIWNKNETEFDEYSTKAFSESSILNKLEEENYQLNMYEPELIWENNDVEKIDNISLDMYKMHFKNFLRNITKFALYKYLPYSFKKYSKVDTLNFDECMVDENGEFFDWSNRNAYDNLNANKLELTDQKYFQFLHIEGGHVPFDYDENVEYIQEEEGTYDKKLQATAKIIKKYIERLKKSNAYDNSVIVVLADHGYWTETNGGRQNPILYIKGLDEHHDMEKSDLPLSYEDLKDAFLDLANGKKSNELFKNIDLNRTRKFIDNAFEHEETMEEYEQKGKAWEPSSAEKTGEKYTR